VRCDSCNLDAHPGQTFGWLVVLSERIGVWPLSRLEYCPDCVEWALDQPGPADKGPASHH
jgi:hypothetical protein